MKGVDDYMIENREVLILGNYCVKNHITMNDLRLVDKTFKQKTNNVTFTAIDRMNKYSSYITETKDFIIDHAKNIIHSKDDSIIISNLQKVLICRILVSNYGTIFTVSELQSILKEFGFHAGRKSIVVYLNRVNKALDSSRCDRYIRSMTKRGYTWNYPVEHKVQ